jgi:hypothetical protein
MPSRRFAPIAVIVLVWSGLAFYYYVGAAVHAEKVNWFKARGDQIAYLVEAKLIFANWHGLNRPPIPQPRNRMPLYPSFLALFYDPHWTDPEFFDHAKAQNIRLSILLLVTIGSVVYMHLPPIAATNVVLILTFGIFIFKAGYAQSELLFYTFFFLSFVAMWHWLEARATSVAYGAGAGVLAALAHLTKAAMLPFVCVGLAVYSGAAVVEYARSKSLAQLGWRAVQTGAFTVSFLLVLAPYLITSKRLTGDYFYNLGTSVVVWFDGWPQAAVAIQTYQPNGWPPGPRSMRPGPRKYLRDHTVGQIVARFESGFMDMIVRSYATFWYLKYLTIYAMVGLTLAVGCWHDFVAILRIHRTLAIFLLLYGIVYLAATAFYAPSSGTGTTRFLLAHVAPFLFATSRLFSVQAFQRWSRSVAGVTVTLTHVQLFVTATVGFDLVFTLWNRLLTTYGGF